jgi:hypothetical protein
VLRCLFGFIFAFDAAVGFGIIETRLDTMGGTLRLTEGMEITGELPPPI